MKSSEDKSEPPSPAKARETLSQTRKYSLMIIHSVHKSELVVLRKKRQQNLTDT